MTAESVPLLRDIDGNGAKLHLLTGRLVSLEGEADEIHAAGLKRAFQNGPDRSAPIRSGSRSLQEFRARDGCV